MPHRLFAFVSRYALSVMLLCALTACGGGDGVRQRLFPPTASVQELAVQADGSWTLKLRLQNFSNVSMLVEEVDATLQIASAQAGKISLRPAVSVPPESAEIVEFTLAPQSAAANHVMNAVNKRSGGNVAYSISGRIVSSEPDRRDDEFEFASRLSTVPGLDRVLR